MEWKKNSFISNGPVQDQFTLGSRKKANKTTPLENVPKMRFIDIQIPDATKNPTSKSGCAAFSHISKSQSLLVMFRYWGKLSRLLANMSTDTPRSNEWPRGDAFAARRLLRNWGIFRALLQTTDYRDSHWCFCHSLSVSFSHPFWAGLKGCRGSCHLSSYVLLLLDRNLAKNR